MGVWMIDLEGPTLKKVCRMGVFSLVLWGVVSCFGGLFQKPSLTLRGMPLKPRSVAELKLLVDIDVHNPNGFDLSVKALQYTVYLDRHVLGGGRLEDDFLVPSSAVTAVQVPVILKLADLSSVLICIMAGKDIPYRIEGHVEVGSFLGSRTILFSKEGRMTITGDLSSK
jgi:LEA14-like dessication related protein